MNEHAREAKRANEQLENVQFEIEESEEQNLVAELPHQQPFYSSPFHDYERTTEAGREFALLDWELSPSGTAVDDDEEELP